MRYKRHRRKIIPFSEDKISAEWNKNAENNLPHRHEHNNSGKKKPTLTLEYFVYLDPSQLKSRSIALCFCLWKANYMRILLQTFRLPNVLSCEEKITRVWTADNWVDDGKGAVERKKSSIQPLSQQDKNGERFGRWFVDNIIYGAYLFNDSNERFSSILQRSANKTANTWALFGILSAFFSGSVWKHLVTIILSKIPLCSAYLQLVTFWCCEHNKSNDVQSLLGGRFSCVGCNWYCSLFAARCLAAVSYLFVSHGPLVACALASLLRFDFIEFTCVDTTVRWHFSPK